MNGGESTEVQEDEHNLDQTLPRDDTTPPSTTIAEPDLAAEMANARDLLSAMFGEANTDWDGDESIDSDMEMAGVNADIPHPADGPLRPNDFEAIPAAYKSLASRRVENWSADGGQTEATAPTPKTTDDREQPSNKRKHLFEPREGGGQFLAMFGACLSQALRPSVTAFFSLISHLDLDAELNVDMGIDLNEPAFPNAPVTFNRSVPSASTPTTNHRVFDSLLPFSFPQKGHVQSVELVRTDDEARIRARWKAARGDLTQEWKRWHREAVKSRRRQGGERVELSETYYERLQECLTSSYVVLCVFHAGFFGHLLLWHITHISTSSLHWQVILLLQNYIVLGILYMGD